MVSGADLSLPTAGMTLSPVQRLLGRYVRHVHAAASVEPTIAVAFARVSELVDPPQALLRPQVLRRVLTMTVAGGRS